MTQSRLLFFVSVLLLGFGLNQHASGQAYPIKPVRLVVPFPAGGGSDNIGRVLAQKLFELLEQQVFVDNRAGAGGSIGTEAVVRSPPDGHTLVLASTSEIAVNPAIYTQLDYYNLKDIRPGAMVAACPLARICS